MQIRKRERPVPIPIPTPDGTKAPVVLNVIEKPIAELLASIHNARLHDDKQIKKLANSIQQFGFNVPILIDEKGEILAGHGRLAAAKQLAMQTVPTICIGHMSPAQKRAFRIADNRLAELSEWDGDLLKDELAALMSFDIDLPDVTGFETAEIDAIVFNPTQAKLAKSDPADKLPAPVAGPSTCRLGDTWQLGTHRITCGDARDAETYHRLLDGSPAQMVFTDPPYNVRVDGHAGGLGKVRHREFAMASGEMSSREFIDFLKAAFTQIAVAADDGAIIFTCIDWAHLYAMLEAGHAAFDELKNIVCWSKTNGGMGSFYRSQHELIPVWKKGTAPHINNIELGKHGRYRTNVWTYAGANSFGRSRMEDLASHPTVKPCALVMDAIKDASKPAGTILDPFGGSGTTLIAAEKTRRHARLIELDPLYVDLTIRRWEQLTGGTARHVETGLTFTETATTRSQQDPATNMTENDDVE